MADDNHNPTPNTLLVEFQAVSYLLPSGKFAIENISLRIDVGEKIALLGANGSGKTTVALLLAGVLSPSSGHIRWATTPQPADVQLLMQNPTMQTLGATIEEELRFGPDLLQWERAEIHRKVHESIVKLGLHGERTLTTLSGGELQQVVGEAVRLLSPQLLIYDEPAMYLYPPRRKAMIEEALREQCAVLWLTPSKAEASRFPRTIELGNVKSAIGNRHSALGTGHLALGDGVKKEEITLKNIVVKGEGKERLVVEKLVIGSGERVGIIGDNGSGKTTLLALLGSVLKPDAGTVTRSREFALTSLAFQFPEMSLLGSTVREEIGGPDPKVNEKIASERLLRFGLEPSDFLNRDPFTLSGGEARRVALAATVHSPDTFLLWDEPTAGLDSQGSNAIAEVLLEQTGGFVVAGHDFDLMERVCDRIILLEDGKVLRDEMGTKIFSEL